MDKIIWFFSGIVICLFVSCNNSDNSGNSASEKPIWIEVEKPETKLSAIATDIEYIPLDSEKVLLGAEIRVFPFEGRYYVWDMKNQRIVVFDQKGKFVFQLSQRGWGPKEYRSLGYFNIDPYNRRLFIKDVGKRYVFYSMDDGSFISEGELTSSFIRMMALSKTTQAWWLYSGDKNAVVKLKAGQSVNRLYVGDAINDNFKWEAIPFPSWEVNPAPRFELSSDGEGNAFAADKVNNILYEFDSVGIKRKIRIETNPGVTTRKDLNFQKGKGFSNTELSKAKCLSANYCQGSKEHIYIGAWKYLEMLYDGKAGTLDIFHTIYNRKTGKSTTINEVVANDIDGIQLCLFFPDPPTLYRGGLYASVYAHTIKDYVEKIEDGDGEMVSEKAFDKVQRLASGLGEDSNPVIAKIKLR
ncbi:hypothetical protein FUAX_07590 [Fulvitalea axinellae]|uniref:6-bladed beta-propeller n=1 Tax=Fulvitalea axinellae TaxID=1182444 RepID=A0AAU9CN46_9BACT|nr:hypothetical protein FUAX_07590 [Fulvitalea axinellae]